MPPNLLVFGVVLRNLMPLWSPCFTYIFSSHLEVFKLFSCLSTLRFHSYISSWHFLFFFMSCAGRLISLFILSTHLWILGNVFISFIFHFFYCFLKLLFFRYWTFWPVLLILHVFSPSCFCHFSFSLSFLPFLFFVWYICLSYPCATLLLVLVSAFSRVLTERTSDPRLSVLSLVKYQEAE